MECISGAALLALVLLVFMPIRALLMLVGASIGLFAFLSVTQTYFSYAFALEHWVGMKLALWALFVFAFMVVLVVACVIYDNVKDRVRWQRD